ncbi:hypothetical protein [Periweissella cryptocerci]|uniref:hypothetical protein n=1 Tax=Periweissella cryptocerci TaxID=2506420 RepID=UPI001404D2C8|nr:hypothetical protein [Periweissella cryptocerci]
MFNLINILIFAFILIAAGLKLARKALDLLTDQNARPALAPIVTKDDVQQHRNQN